MKWIMLVLSSFSSSWWQLEKILKHLQKLAVFLPLVLTFWSGSPCAPSNKACFRQSFLKFRQFSSICFLFSLFIFTSLNPIWSESLTSMIRSEGLRMQGKYLKLHKKRRRNWRGLFVAIVIATYSVFKAINVVVFLFISLSVTVSHFEVQRDSYLAISYTGNFKDYLKSDLTLVLPEWTLVFSV